MTILTEVKSSDVYVEDDKVVVRLDIGGARVSLLFYSAMAHAVGTAMIKGSLIADGKLKPEG